MSTMRGIFQRRNIKGSLTQQAILNNSFGSVNNSSVSQTKPPFELNQNSANRACSLDRYATTTAQSQIINHDINKKDIQVDFNQLRQEISHSIKILSSPICERSYIDDSSKIQLKSSDSHGQIAAFTDRNQLKVNYPKREDLQYQHVSDYQQQLKKNQKDKHQSREDQQNQHKSREDQRQSREDQHQSRENTKRQYIDRSNREFEKEDRVRNQKDILQNKYSNSQRIVPPSQIQNNSSFSSTQKYIYTPIQIQKQYDNQIFKENNIYFKNVMKDEKKVFNQSFNQPSSYLSSVVKGLDVARNASFDFGQGDKYQTGRVFADKPISYQPLTQFNSNHVYIDKRNNNNDKPFNQSFSDALFNNNLPSQSISSLINQQQSSSSKHYSQQKQQLPINKSINNSHITTNSSLGTSIKNFSFQYQNNNKENIINENHNYFNHSGNQYLQKQYTNQSQEDNFNNYSQNFESQKPTFQNPHPPSHNNDIQQIKYPISNDLKNQSQKRDINRDFLLNDDQIGFENKSQDIKQQEYKHQQQKEEKGEQHQQVQHQQKQQQQQQQKQQQLLYTHIILADEQFESANTDNHNQSQKQQLQQSRNDTVNISKEEDEEQQFQNQENQRARTIQTDNSYDRMKESEIKELKTVLNDSNQQVKDLLKENRKLNEKYQSSNEEQVKTQHKLENLQSHYQDLQLKLHTEKANNLKQSEFQVKYNELQQKYDECYENNKILLNKIEKINQSADEKVSKFETKYEIQCDKLEKTLDKIDQLSVQNTEIVIQSQKERENLLQMVNEAKQKQEVQLKEKQTLMTELQEVKNQLAELKHFKDQYDSKLKERGEQIESLQRQLLEKTANIDILKQSIQENMNQLSDIQMESRRRELDLKSQYSKLIFDNQTLQECVDINRVEKETLNSKLKRLTQNLDDIEAIRAENADLAYQFKEMYKENEQLLHVIKEKELEGQENQNLIATIATLKEENKKLLRMIDPQREENEHLHRIIDPLKEENKHLLGMIDTLKEQNANIIRFIDPVKEENKNISEQKQSTMKELEEARNEIVSLQQKVRKIDQELKDVQCAYDELKQNTLNLSKQKVEEYNDCQEQMNDYKQKYTSLKQRYMIESEKQQQYIKTFSELEKSYDHLLKEYNQQKACQQQFTSLQQKIADQSIQLEEMQFAAQQNAKNESILINLQQIIQQQEVAINNLNNERLNLLNNNSFKQSMTQIHSENQAITLKFTEKMKEVEYLKMQLMNFTQTDSIVNDLKSKLAHVINENQRLNQILFERCKSSWN